MNSSVILTVILGTAMLRLNVNWLLTHFNHRRSLRRSQNIHDKTVFCQIWKTPESQSVLMSTETSDQTVSDCRDERKHQITQVI